MSPSPIEIVESWINAVNTGHVKEALSLSSASIRIIGPRGVAEGHDILRQWVTNAGASFSTRARYARGPAVVIAQRGEWRDQKTREITGTAEVATRFVVQDDSIIELERYHELSVALNDAGLTTKNLVQHGA